MATATAIRETATNGKTAAVKEPATPPVIHIARLKRETMLVPILGTSSLIVNQFPEKAKRQMLDNMQGRKNPREIRDPQREYESAFYRLLDGTAGIPAIGFWQATIGGARFYANVKMTEARQYIFPFKGERGEGGSSLVRITGSDPYMREDVVTVGRGGTDLRYRPEWVEWSTTILVTFAASVISKDSVLSLIDAGGMGVGVCEWRPEKNGDHGTYMIDPNRDVEVVQ